ncbi:hypothetical protein COLO4_24577 [Corchorus olitorius]|uniref:MRN complex-interacting protein N-terminal domain-containing protein n=1 Tax=Corchorus olitorius TaxID=93759 RepID=A0A1R3I8Z3_9ROSI|nr:hypothetical protein COLO4_24577 [Corchorus olitorius]
MLHNAGNFLFLFAVKQKKKSSNKWTCVVCNQKQSVFKVFAQGPMAKDLRNFVETFNMSRKFTDQNQPFDPNFEADDGGDPENQRKRRSDWTEYLDPEDDRVALQEEERGDDLEPKIVTELPPKEKFKRPKLNNYESEEDGGHQFYKPVFSNRNSRNDLLISQVATAKGNSKWRDHITEEGDFGITNFKDDINKWGDAVIGGKYLNHNSNSTSR